MTKSQKKWLERCWFVEWEEVVASVPDSDEREAQEETEGAANLGNQGGDGVDQLLPLHEGVVRGRPELEEEMLAAPRQEQFLTFLEVKIRASTVMDCMTKRLNVKVMQTIRYSW